MKPAELKKRFSDQAGAQSLLDMCSELKLSHREYEHLADTVFTETAADAALATFLSHHTKKKSLAGRFLLNLLPAREPIHAVESSSRLAAA